MIGGLKFVFEPPVLRFFIGKLETIGNWEQNLADAFKKEVGGQ
jgi:tryptophanase